MSNPVRISKVISKAMSAGDSYEIKGSDLAPLSQWFIVALFGHVFAHQQCS